MEQWTEYLEEHGLTENRYACILARSLEDPKLADIGWFRRAMGAIELYEKLDTTAMKTVKGIKEPTLTYKHVCYLIRKYEASEKRWARQRSLFETDKIKYRAYIVDLIILRREEGFSYRQIAEELTTKVFPTMQGKAVWSPSVIGVMCKKASN